MRPPSYTWKSSTEPLSIEVALDVVQQLGLAAMQAFKSVPRRGLEIGGILLGHGETRHGVTAIQVLGFEPLESEHRSGPSYRLSKADLGLLDEALARHPDAVGLFRTHTRSNSLEIEEDDATIFNRCFTTPDRLFLLVRPAGGEAAFFLAKGGALESVHEFPFRPGDLAPAAAEPVAQAPIPKKRKWLIPVVAGGLGVMAGAGALRFEYRRPVPAAPAAMPQPDAVTLEVRRDGNALKLLWDRSSPTIRQADRGVLYIVDGKKQSQLNLDAGELTTGLLSYWPQTGDVSFRLETFAGGRKSVSSIRAVGVEPIPAVPAPPVATADREKRPAARKPAPAERQTPVRQEETPEAAVSERRPSPFERPVPEFAAAPQADASVPKHPAPPPVVPPPVVPPDPAPQVSVAAEPVEGSRLGRMIAKIPLLRRLKKQPQPYVPPQPVHQAEPVLTAGARRSVTDPIPIDVKVYVTDTGNVDYAELMTDETRANRELASAAVYAARRWRFTPARLGEQNVAGEVILHFRFRPAELSAVR